MKARRAGAVRQPVQFPAAAGVRKGRAPQSPYQRWAHVKTDCIVTDHTGPKQALLDQVRALSGNNAIQFDLRLLSLSAIMAIGMLRLRTSSKPTATWNPRWTMRWALISSYAASLCPAGTWHGRDCSCPTRVLVCPRPNASRPSVKPSESPR